MKIKCLYCPTYMKKEKSGDCFLYTTACQCQYQFYSFEKDVLHQYDIDIPKNHKLPWSNLKGWRVFDETRFRAWKSPNISITHNRYMNIEPNIKSIQKLINKLLALENFK